MHTKKITALGAAFAAASILLAVVGLQKPAQASSLTAPGDLATAHASMNGDSPSDCQKCHDPQQKAVADARCMATGCHADIKAEKDGKSGLHGIPHVFRTKSCGACHVDHKGKGGDLLAVAWSGAAEDPKGTQANFDHRMTGFALGGAHEKLACEKCHTGKTPSGAVSFLSNTKTKAGASKTCLAAGCHIDPHGFALTSPSHDCTLCHSLSDGDWKKAPEKMRFDHNTTAFKLGGAHATVVKGGFTGCETCHTTEPKFIRSSACVDCHKKEEEKSPHKDAYGKQSCGAAGCHNETTWKMKGSLVGGGPGGNANHKSFGKVDLGKAHGAVGCEKCHAGGPVKTTLAGVSMDSCSNTGCHVNIHGERWIAAMPGHTEKKACDLCHSNNLLKWTDLTVATKDHKTWSDLELTGKHLELGCINEKCHHSTATVVPQSKQCTYCHDTPASHKGTDRAQNCEKCHNTGAWAIGPTSVSALGAGNTFDHVSATRTSSDPGFALLGAHSKVACGSCHPEAAEAGASIKVRPSKECVTCHAAKNPHGKKLTEPCDSCHAVTTWKDSSFNVAAHATKTTFALTGKHASVACQACHKTLEFKETPSECEGCHPDDHHKGHMALTAADGSKRTNCALCHTTATWAGAKGGVSATVAKANGLDANSDGCMRCHSKLEAFHPKGEQATCVGCHGGNGAGRDENEAHVHPPSEARKQGFGKPGMGFPHNVFGDMEHADPAYVRFVNPGDLRVADKTCGVCHPDEFKKVRTSIMATSANVPTATLYNNAASESQAAQYGDSFMPDGSPAKMLSDPPPDATQKQHGAVPMLFPLPRWEATADPDSFRILEQGNDAAGNRGRGTGFKIAGVFLNLVKTRLNDPALWLPGTNDAPGEYRGSGCTACHVLYANDATAANSGSIAQYGHDGKSISTDTSIPHNESGHPLKHQLTTSVPLSQCITCHHHQGNGALGSYAGYVWHDQESDADKLKELDGFPGGAGQAALALANPKMEQVQFADYHGHKWNYRAVYWTDRRGDMLDAKGAAIAPTDPDKWKKAVHLKDIHLEKGMQCIDCHGKQDMHGDGFLYTAMLDASEVGCQDCHGTPSDRATLKTRGTAAGPRSLRDDETPFGQKVFYFKNNKLYQRSKMTADMEWEVPQVKDVITPGNPAYNPKAEKAMGLKVDGKLAHDPSKMECYTCHSAWNLSCFGCHLPFDVNTRAKDLHRGDGDSFGYAEYNPQVIRTDAYTLGIDGTTLGNKISPMRSASAVVVSVRDGNREVVVNQQPTVSSSGLSGDAITPNIPHTVRSRQTKTCTDCHPSEKGDNNSYMADRLGLGTNAANWMGDYIYVAAGKRIGAVRLTEGYEPRPVIGSDFHKVLHPASYEKFERRGRTLDEAETASSRGARSIQVLGEFALVADGHRGLVVYDTALVADKGAAQKIVESPTLYFGQKLRVNTKDAAWVALPSSMPMIATRQLGPDRTQPKVAEIFKYAFVADRVEGLVVVNTSTLVDGNPSNNFLRADARFNPNGQLDGAQHIAIDGNYLLISCKAGVAVVNVEKPTEPRMVKMVTGLSDAHAVAVQFRYAFVADAAGVEVLDVTDPEKVELVANAKVALHDARDLVALRDYLYVADGKDGLAIVDITKSTSPQLVKTWDGEGKIHDATGITVGTTNATTFAYVADGAGGLRVVSLIEPSRVPGHLGFSPVPSPKLTATWRSSHPVLGVAEGQKRDRYVDESGNELSVGGRIGARALNPTEMRRMYMHDGKPFTVHDPVDNAGAAASADPAALEPHKAEALKPAGSKGTGTDSTAALAP